MVNLESLRVLWVAGRRGEILLLGPVHQRLARTAGVKPTAWFLGTGEDGTAAYQALDFLGLRPDEVGPLCHPAEQPAVRLTILLERIETFMRRRKGQRLIFTGCGPAAAAAAICCHARGNPGLWLRPADPAGLIPRLRWEAGLARIVEACVPAVTIIDVEPVPDLTRLAGMSPATAGESTSPSRPVESEIPGLRPAPPRILWAVLRRDWGMFSDTEARLARALGAAAAARPEVDFVVLSNLNAMLERPLASLKHKPDNLLVTPPLPYPVYRGLLGGCAGVTTDSASIASEALAIGKPVAALGELPGAGATELLAPCVPADLNGPPWVDWIERAVGREPISKPAVAAEPWLDRVGAAVGEWLTAS